MVSYYSFFKYGLVRPVSKLLWRPTVTGAENVPETGGGLLAGNHIGSGETFLLPAMIDRHLVYPAKAELFKGDKGLGSKILAWFLKAVDQVPMDRSGGRASAEGLTPVLDHLAAGGLVGIFPEGTRSVDGRLYRGHTGVIRLALATEVPIIPVGFKRTEFVRTRLGIPWLHRPEIHIGTPVSLADVDPSTLNGASLRVLTRRVMDAIQELSGQEYVDQYPPRRRRVASAPPAVQPGSDPSPPEA